jgi:hypothetical protein
MALHSHYDHGHGGDDSAAAAGITAGMMLAILGFIAAVVIVFALLVWTPWNDGTDTSTNNITNNPIPSQQNNNPGGGSNTQPGGGNTLPGGGSNSGGGSSSGGSSSGGSSSGGSSNTLPR